MEPNTTKSFSFIIAAEGSGKVKQMHYNLVKDGTLKSNVSAKLGTLKFSISELEVGGNIKVTITNDEVFDIDYEIVVLKLLR